ncbi:hypothetical protein LTR17_009912 [Elasticomyces elasticus]|nr:hypothetical protein LTR17_009912 [Elasticomyces elasticus]
MLTRPRLSSSAFDGSRMEVIVLALTGMAGETSNEACNGCSTHTDQCEHHNNAQITDIEDYKTELTTLRARTKELEEKLSNLHTGSGKTLRSARWFDRPDDRAMSALYADRYMNYGLTTEELLSGKPIIGIAQSGKQMLS